MLLVSLNPPLPTEIIAPLLSVIFFEKVIVRRKHELVTVQHVQVESTLHNLGSLSYSHYNVSYKIQHINTEQKMTK